MDEFHDFCEDENVSTTEMHRDRSTMYTEREMRTFFEKFNRAQSFMLILPAEFAARISTFNFRLKIEDEKKSYL